MIFIYTFVLETSNIIILQQYNLIHQRVGAYQNILFMGGWVTDFTLNTLLMHNSISSLNSSITRVPLWPRDVWLYLKGQHLWIENKHKKLMSQLMVNSWPFTSELGHFKHEKINKKSGKQKKQQKKQPKLCRDWRFEIFIFSWFAVCRWSFNNEF